VKNGEKKYQQYQFFCIGNISNGFLTVSLHAIHQRGFFDKKRLYRASDMTLPTTKGKTGREIDI